jgi:hypothetical protein
MQMNNNIPSREMILALALFTTSAIAAPTGTAPHANRVLTGGGSGDARTLDVPEGDPADVAIVDPTARVGGEDVLCGPPAPRMTGAAEGSVAAWTSSLDAKLEVLDGLADSTSIRLGFSKAIKGEVQPLGEIKFGYDGAVWADRYFVINMPPPIPFRDPLHSVLVLRNNGNAGIGTLNPGSRLTVVGVIESTSGGIKFPDGTVQTSASVGSAVDGIHCWDLNGNGIADLAAEDTNGDGDVTVADCQGPPGRSFDSVAMCSDSMVSCDGAEGSVRASCGIGWERVSCTSGPCDIDVGANSCSGDNACWVCAMAAPLQTASGQRYQDVSK